jgi:hypothetical protein
MVEVGGSSSVSGVGGHMLADLAILAYNCNCRVYDHLVKKDGKIPIKNN